MKERNDGMREKDERREEVGSDDGETDVFPPLRAGINPL